MKYAMLNALTEPGAGMISHLIDKVGKASIITAYSVVVADEAGVVELAEHTHSAWGLPEYALLTTIIGTVTFIVKNVIESRKAFLEVKIKKQKLESKE